MTKEKASVPDAWDDDWESLADKPAEAENEAPKEPVKVSKRERRAQHAEAQRKLWESAEAPEKPIFLQAQGAAPLTSDFKAPMKLLSRKPPTASSGVTGAMGSMSVADDDDSEEEERRRAAESFAERQAKAQREREEKQRKYAEARERILGSPAEQSQSRSSSKGGQHSRSRNSSRGKGRSRPDMEGIGSIDQSPARGNASKRLLFDPNYTSKPTSSFAQRSSTSDVRLESAAESQHIRAPRGPDGSGKGFGFAPREDKTDPAT